MEDNKQNYIKLNKEESYLLEDKTAGGCLLRISKEQTKNKILMDSRSLCVQKLDATDYLRKSIWGSIFFKRHSILDMLNKYPFLYNDVDIVTLFQCLSLVLLELEFRDMEIDIIYNSKE